uniref:F-box domain-containing protein n=1 Tax=Oryza glumipatula TaxID=40148 RepID=A0A0D9Z7U3_9ORYZ
MDYDDRERRRGRRAPAEALPNDLVEEILLRLPAPSIGRCRAVCKAWLSRTSQPDFLRAHAAARSCTATVTATATVETRTTTPRGRSCATVRIRQLGRKCSGAVAASLAMSFVSASEPVRSITAVIGFWDGIQCAAHILFGPGRGVERYVLCNPLTEACTIVPAPATDGFLVGGYTHPTTSRFHIMHANFFTTMETFWILRLGENSAWREVRRPALATTRVCIKFLCAPPVRLHGCLHWLASSASSAQFLVAVFNMEREEFRLMEAPGGQGVRDDNLSHSHTMMGIHITHCHGKLCALVGEPGANALGMWVLEDYSDPTSWRLQRKIDYYYSCGAAAGAALDDDPHAAAAQTFRARFSTADVVEVLPNGVDDDDEGEEILLQLGDEEVVYNVGRAAWCRWGILPLTTRRLMMHRHCILPREVSFGDASQVD